MTRSKRAAQLFRQDVVRLEPLLKWPGGKRWLAPWLADLIRDNLTGRYFEPFLGGGSLFFALRPRRSTLSDINPELIETYTTIRDSHCRVLRRLRNMGVSEREYYSIRNATPLNRVGRAARFLYLNRTAFAGIYRLNRKGAFNVPYGGGDRTPEIVCRAGFLSTVAQLLAGADLRCDDFEPIMSLACSGDVVYCDPTYTVTHNNNGFIRYNEVNFSWEDQKRLALAARNAQRRGAFVVVSNAHHTALRQLYPSAESYVVERPCLIAPRAEFRRIVAEYVFVLDPELG
ncbi:MAG: Dam family site-specific DNA-(adenine-N6)-methyltransferase [Bryobacteraceae bacterium]